jgi:hypothetical protein
MKFNIIYGIYVKKNILLMEFNILLYVMNIIMSLAYVIVYYASIQRELV